MSFSLPTGWVFQSASNNGNTVTYTRPGHTVQAPRLAIFSRVIPSYDARAKAWSIPSYRVRIVDGVVDVDGNPISTRTTADLTFRHSMAGNGAARGDEVVTDLNAVLDATGFAQAVFAGQEFPGTTQ